MRGENHARALLILAPLDLWRGWEATAEPAVPRVDLTRVALGGHSRGGEAAARAAELDRRGRLPSDALKPLRERVGGPLGVRSVIAIGPSDGQYRLGDRPTSLRGVDYLVLHGGFDAAGEVAGLPLVGTQGVPPYLPTLVTRLAPFEVVRYLPDAYPLFQRIGLPLADLLAANPAIDVARTFEIALVFDQVPAGVLALRSLGLAPR